MSFQTKKFESIVASMINWVSSATDKITDFNTGSVIRTILEAVAIELEELYYQLLRAVEEAIEEAIYRTFNFPKNPAQRSTGNILFTRDSANEDVLTIPQGSLVATETEPIVYFETQAAETITAVAGTSTGGGTTQLIDTTKNFFSLGITVGSKVKNITDGGESPTAGVISLATTTNPYDTLNFGTLTNGASFSNFIGKVYFDTGGVISVVSVANGGTGYSIGDVLAIAGGVGGTVTVASLTGPGPAPVSTVTLTTAGSQYTSGVLATTGGGANDCTLNVTATTLATDYTTAAQLVDSVYFPVSLVTGFDHLYIGFDAPFGVFAFYRGSGTQQNVVGVMSGEYWTGVSWQPLTYFVDGTKGGSNKPFSTNGNISWSTPSNWARTTYPTTGPTFNLYWIRLKTDTTCTAGSEGDATQFLGNTYKVLVMTKNIAVQCQAIGTAGNVDANTITNMLSSIAGITTVTNPAAFSDGAEEETDSERKTRFALYIQSLARATRGALEYAATSVDQVVSAKAVDDIRATVLRWDESGLAFTDITTAMRVPGDAGVALFPASDTTDNALYFGASEIFNYINIHLVVAGTVASNDTIWEYCNSADGLSWATLSCVDGTNPGGGSPGPLQQNGTVSFTPPNDWTAAELDSLLRMWVRLRITSTGTVYSAPRPTGDWCSLPPGFGYVDLYVHDGSGDLNSTLRASVESSVALYAGCGIIVTVKPPEKIIPTITVRLLVTANYDPDDIALKVRQAIIDYLNTKVLSEDLYVADLYQLIMNYNDQAILNCTIDECSTRTGALTPPADVLDIIVWSAAVVRPNTLAASPLPEAITVTGVGI
jgi:uncharacterized phage protein gp47/JayE